MEYSALSGDDALLFVEVGFLYLVFRFQHTPGLQPVDRGILAKVEEAKISLQSLKAQHEADLEVRTCAY